MHLRLSKFISSKRRLSCFPNFVGPQNQCIQFSHSVASDSLWPHGLQHARLPWSSPTPEACSNSCPSSQWRHPTISSCRPLLLPSIFPSIKVFSKESVLHIRWPKYWSFSFSISPSNEYSGLTSFRIDWFDLLAVRGAPKSLPQHHSSKASIFGSQLSSQYNSHIHSTSCEMLGWMNRKLESRQHGEISITSDMQMTPHLWQKVKKN